MITVAYINLWQQRVGAIAWDEKKQLGTFEFDPTFLSSQLNIAPLKMPLEAATNRLFAFPELSKTATFKGLPGLLADVLPDFYGTQLINVWLAKNGRAANSLNPVELLCFIGTRGMGALEFEPAQPAAPATATLVELESLVSIAQQLLGGKKKFSTILKASQQKALSDILKIGTSAGGTNAKAIIAYNPLTKVVRSGQSKAPPGFSHWLLKFDGVTDGQIGTTMGFGRVEMAYYLMASDAGVEMSECRLLEENTRAHFMTKRFDRDTTQGKLHLQSFCALQHYNFNDVGSYSYEQLFETMRLIRLPYSAAEQLYRRMVFNVMAKNYNDHTKNFAFLMSKSGQWQLAPAFDMCYAYRPNTNWVDQHALSINGKRKHITKADLLELAYKMNIKQAPHIISQVADVTANWLHYAKKTGVEKELKTEIKKNLIVLK